MTNSLLEDFNEQLKRDQQFLKSIKKNPQLYYFQLGNCIYERLYNNKNSFEMKDIFYNKSSKTEKELIQLNAIKKSYNDTYTT